MLPLEDFYKQSAKELNCRGKLLSLHEPQIMVIINTTPESFYDVGKHFEFDKAIEKALLMIQQGANIIDIGGETTQPNSLPVDKDEEIRRTIPLITELRNLNKDIVISIDTNKSLVAEMALQAGADIVNDISSLRFDTSLAELLADYTDVPVVLMHMQGTPETMQVNPQYNDVIDDLKSFFDERISFCISKGISQDRLIIDPGIGFGKRLKHNLEILRRIDEFHSLNVPVLLGASRKSFIKGIYVSEPHERLSGSLATTALAFYNGIQIIRVHDVLEHHQLLATLKAIY
jgi:dihydropteroate synthase